MTMTLSGTSIFDTALHGLYSLRIELAFLLVFGLLYLTGRSSQLRLPLSGKEGTKKPKQEVSTPGAIPSKRRRPNDGPGRAQRSAGQRGSTGTAGCMQAPGSAPPEADKLKDPSWLVPEVVQLSRTQAHQALQIYQAAQLAGLKLSDVPLPDLRQLLTALITASIRAGEIDEALSLLRVLQELGQGQGISSSLLSSVTKLCTSKQYFAECLSIYDLVSTDMGSGLAMDDRSIWSCLLFCAVEAKAFQRCRLFFDRLKAAGQPTAKDYGNMIRCTASTGESEVALALVREMQEGGVAIDSVVYNTALATCVAADNVDQARELLEEMERVGGVADVITYNTLAKGYAKAGLMDSCFELFNHMRGRGIEPSQVTYGILLDGCINDNRVDRAAEVYERMTQEGCAMNTVLYTTLIKGFARAGQVDQAMRVYGQMRAEGSVPPDLITFSILIKANCDEGRLDSALKLLEAMIDLKLRPDEVIFNNLLGGCVRDSNAVLAKRLYQEMTSANIRPSNATFSILIRLYAQCKLLDEAVEMLRTEPKAQGIIAEPRLFSQLVLCCLRERQGRRAVEVYRLMLEHSTPTAAAYSSMLGMCVKLNMLDTGVEILSLAAAVGARVDQRDAVALLEAAIRKKKPQCADACRVAMKRLGHTGSLPAS